VQEAGESSGTIYRFVSSSGPHDATLLQAREQLENVCSYFIFIGARVPLKQVVNNRGHGPVSIEAYEDVTRWAAKLQSALRHQQHILGWMKPTTWSESRDGVHVRINACFQH
jgi:hypothetical protein